MERVDALVKRLPPDEPEPEPAAPSYVETSSIQDKEDNDSRQENTVLVPQRATRPSSRESLQPQHAQSLRSASNLADPRYSIGSMGTVPSSALGDDSPTWPGHQFHDYNSTNPHSAIQSTKLKEDGLTQLSHEDPKDVYRKEHNELSIVASKQENRLAPKTVPVPENAHRGTEKPQVDPESLESIERLRKRGSLSIRRRYTIGFAVFVALIALLLLVFMLSFQTSKTMTRAGFTASTTVVFFSVAAILWATDRTMVETLIAMNIVIVYGIFLNGQIDVFLNYATDN